VPGNVYPNVIVVHGPLAGTTLRYVGRMQHPHHAGQELVVVDGGKLACGCETLLTLPAEFCRPCPEPLPWWGRVKLRWARLLLRCVAWSEAHHRPSHEPDLDKLPSADPRLATLADELLAERKENRELRGRIATLEAV